jgi:L-asparaginase II
MHPGPVLAQEQRNGRIQAVHTGHVVVLSPDGEPRLMWGDVATATYWRSAAKPLQAIPFAAVADSLGLGAKETALACGSHAAEPFHVATARRILEAAGLDESWLKCGVHDPGPQAGPQPPDGWSALHNNCSGKHAAMLATCKARGLDLASYLSPEHPLQQEIHGFVAEAAGVGFVPHGIDGCGLPTYWLSVTQLAMAFQWLHREQGGVFDAMARAPLMVGGTGNADSELASHTRGRLVSKYGALGVVGAVNRETGEAVAVKMDAGNAVAARAVALAAMREAGWLQPEEAMLLAEHLRPPVRNHARVLLGHVEPRV